MKKRGFTLIELILVISIISVILSALSLSFSKKEVYKAKKDLSNIKRNLEVSRNMAITKRKMSSVKFYENKYIINCGNFSREYEYSNLLIKSNMSNINNVVFTKNGIPDFNGSGTIVFILKDDFYKITIEPITGKVNLRNEKRILSN